MIIYLVMVSIILLLEVLLTAYVTTTMIKKKSIISNDNVIYLGVSAGLLYVLYLIALLDSTGVDFFDFFATINNALDAFAFKFELDLIRSLTGKHVLFLIAFIYTVLLTSLSTVLAVITLFKHRIFNSIRLKKVFNNKGDIILGDSTTAREYLKSNKNSIIWDDKADYKELTKENIGICNLKLNAKNLARKIKDSEHHIILFKDSSYSYSDVLELYEEAISIRKAKGYSLDENNALFLHIEANVEEQPTINEQFIANVSDGGNSYVTCFNKYELFARKFLMDYPITKYIPRNFFEDKNCALKEDKKINVVFLGFGKVNLELFKMMAMEFQFASYNKKKEQFYVNQVNYYLYDNNKNNLNENAIAILESDLDKMYKNADLEKMEKVCNIYKKADNVYSYETKEELSNLINNDSYTYIVVSLESDLENVAYAQNLVGFLEEGNYKVFARVKEDALYNEKNKTKQDNLITYFGKEDILNHDNIVNEKLIEFAQRTNMIYSKNSPITKKEILAWQKIILVKQYANIYQSISMFFKLNLMGFDIVKKEDLDGFKTVSKEEFENVCPKVDYNSLKYEDYFKDNLYNLIGFIEHSRWNAHFLLSGYKPMNFSEFAPLNGEGRSSHQKHGMIKKHACLTSNYKGLDKLIKTQYLMDEYKERYIECDIDKIAAKSYNSKAFKECAKTYYYDFMIVNEIYDILDVLGYVIIKR